MSRSERLRIAVRYDICISEEICQKVINQKKCREKRSAGYLIFCYNEK